MTTERWIFTQILTDGGLEIPVTGKGLDQTEAQRNAQKRSNFMRYDGIKRNILTQIVDDPSPGASANQDQSTGDAFFNLMGPGGFNGKKIRLLLPHISTQILIPGTNRISPTLLAGHFDQMTDGKGNGFYMFINGFMKE